MSAVVTGKCSHDPAPAPPGGRASRPVRGVRGAPWQGGVAGWLLSDWGPLTQAGPGTATWPQTVANSTPLGQSGPVTSFSARERDSDPSCKCAPVKAGMTSSPKSRQHGDWAETLCAAAPAGHLGNWQAVGTQSGAAECQRLEERITPPTLVARGRHSPGGREPGWQSLPCSASSPVS